MRNRRSNLSNIAVGFALLTFVALFLSPAFAAVTQAVPVEEWNKTFGGIEYDFTYSVQQTSDGGYILAGGTESYGAGGYDAWLIKTENNGKQQWNKTFGGTEDDLVYSVQQTSDGGYVLAGSTKSGYKVSTDVSCNTWLIKTDSSGDQEWNKTFSHYYLDNHDNRLESVQQTSDGGYILAGTEAVYVLDGWSRTWVYYAWLIKTDSSGDQEWDKTFAAGSSAASVQQTSDGGYILAGTKLESGVRNVWLIKTNSSGNQEWNKTFVAGSSAASVQQTSDGGYILAITTGYDIEENTDSLLIKMDSSGNQEWNKTFDFNDWDTTRSVQQTSDGGYVLAGDFAPYGGITHSDAFLIKTDSSGNQEWSKTFSSEDYHIDDIPYSVKQTLDGGYILVGIKGSDAWLIKIAPDIIQPVDNPPVLATIGNKTIVENVLLGFTISATDIDGDIITYSATGLPPGATLDTNTGVFSWTPATGTAGIYEVTFISTAKDLNDLETIIITVSDWNPWNDPNSASGDSIALAELQEAIYDWRFGITLSNGENVDLTRLQGLIYSWRFG